MEQNSERDRAARPRASRRLIDVSRRAAKWAAAILVVSLVLPAATKQWSDNQQQRQLKTGVTSALAAAVSEATTRGGFLLADRITDARKDKELLTAYQDTLVTWKSDAGAIDGQIVGYFARSDDALVKAMRAYTRIVESYLGYCRFFQDVGDRRRYLKQYESNLSIIREQLEVRPELAIVPASVESSRGGADWSPPKTFKEDAQNVWAQNIVNASAPLIREIHERQPNGLEVGAGAFIRQIIPFN